jgi:hypothetical protein
MESLAGNATRGHRRRRRRLVAGTKPFLGAGIEGFEWLLAAHPRPLRRCPVTCKEVISFLMDYLSGELPVRQRMTFKVHLLLCKACRTYLQTYQQTVRLEKDAYAEDPRLEDVPEQLVHAILSARNQKK